MTAGAPHLPVSVDPLVAEAKQRARQRRLRIGLIAVAIVAAAAALFGAELRGGGAVAPVPANLTVLVVSQGFPGQHTSLLMNGGRALFHLKCDPAGGDVADPAKACAAIAAQPRLVTDPTPYLANGTRTEGPVSLGRIPAMQSCPSNPAKWCPANGPDYFTITGTVNGKPVHFSGGGLFSTDVPLVAKLGLATRLGAPVVRLEPQRRAFVAMSHTHRFAPGVLRPGDLVTCRATHSYRGFPLAMTVPVHPGNAPQQFSAMPGLMAIRIRADGSVLAACFPRDRMPLSERGRTMIPANWPPKSLRP